MIRTSNQTPSKGNCSTKNPRALRNRIRGFRLQIEAVRHVGINAGPENVEFMLSELAALEEMANEMGNELSAHRWNYQKRADDAAQAQAKAVVAASEGESGNVILWPVVGRPIGDGR